MSKVSKGFGLWSAAMVALMISVGIIEVVSNLVNLNWNFVVPVVIWVIIAYFSDREPGPWLAGLLASFLRFVAKQLNKLASELTDEETTEMFSGKEDIEKFVQNAVENMKRPDEKNIN